MRSSSVFRKKQLQKKTAGKVKCAIDMVAQACTLKLRKKIVDLHVFFFNGKNFLSKDSFEHLEYSFEIPGENFSQKIPGSFRPKSEIKTTETFFFLRIALFAQKCSSRLVECRFDDPAEKLPKKPGKKSTHSPKICRSIFRKHLQKGEILKEKFQSKNSSGHS